jgi:hypothetical protein
MYEGIFNYQGIKPYNHAYIIGEKPNKKLLVDLSRHPIWNDWFIEIDDVNNPYKETDMTDVCINKRKLNYNEMLKELEYYTSIQGEILIKNVLNISK